jgi:hypothetical protein
VCCHLCHYLLQLNSVVLVVHQLFLLWLSYAVLFVVVLVLLLMLLRFLSVGHVVAVARCTSLLLF